MVADGDAHCEIHWEIAHCLFLSPDKISELQISDIRSWRDTIFEVVAYVAIGKVESKFALDVIRQASSIIGQSTELAEAVVDAIWLHDVQISAVKLEPAHRYLAALVDALEAAGVVSLTSFKKHLDEELLTSAGLTNSNTFSKRLKKLNTDQVYRQHKYNLLHEESEGYSKVTALLSRLQIQAAPAYLPKSLQALIGGFDLDPNRVMDMVLSSLQYSCIVSSTTSPAINVLLKLLEQVKLGASMPQILGFKFQKCSTKMSTSLCRLTATLLSAGTISLDALLPHLAPSMEKLAEITKRHAKMIEEASRLAGTVSLSHSAEHNDASPATAVSRYRYPPEGKSSPIVGIIEALLWDRRWLLVRPLLSCLEDTGALPVCGQCRLALCSMVKFAIAPLYCKLSPNSLQFATRWQPLGISSVDVGPLQQYRTFDDTASVQRLFQVLEPLCCHLHVGIASDASLVTQLARIIKFLLRPQHARGAHEAKRLLEYVILPSMSILSVNPGCVCEIWAATKKFPCRERHSLYSTWRGRSLEREAVGTKHFEVAEAECKAGYHARQSLKRVANDKKNSKHVGRVLAKAAHSNPLVVFRVILSQVESYGNMIQPIVESLGFLSPLALDVLSYMLSSHLADTSRHKLQNDGINIAHWFQHLSHFTGVYYRAYPQTELQALIEFLMLRLEDGDSLYLLVFDELLARMGGCEVLEDLSDAQIGGLAGGETLRREMLAFSKASKRAVSKLQEALCTLSTAIPMLALVAQQRGYSLFRGKVNHVKLLGQLFDRCQMVLVQLVDFLSRSTAHSTVTGTGERCPYSELLPDLCKMSALHLEPQIALHAARPLIAEAAAAHRRELRAKIPISSNSKSSLCKWEPGGKALRSSLPARDWGALTSDLYLIFWSLSLYDVTVPTREYDAQIALIRSKINVAHREFPDADRRKKETARCLNTINSLESELGFQRHHYQQIMTDLEARRNSLLGSIVEGQRRSISEALLENCIMPRVTITPEDALFCAIFFKQLHSLETTNFSSLQYYDRVVKDVFPVIYCATDQEARCLGIFLRATFEPLACWRFDRRLYDMEAGSKLGFSVAIGSASKCSYEQYCAVFTKWHDKITQVALHSLSHYEDHGRACLLVLIRLIGVYPIYKHVSTQLLGLLEALQIQEDMKDVQTMAKRYCTLLKKSENTLVEESLLKRDILSSNVQVPAPGPKRQASAASKQRRSFET